jgi:hypothetical protein
MIWKLDLHSSWGNNPIPLLSLDDHNISHFFPKLSPSSPQLPFRAHLPPVALSFALKIKSTAQRA